jgi:hypothetical protein
MQRRVEEEFFNMTFILFRHSERFLQRHSTKNRRSHVSSFAREDFLMFRREPKEEFLNMTFILFRHSERFLQRQSTKNMNCHEFQLVDIEKDF